MAEAKEDSEAEEMEGGDAGDTDAGGSDTDLDKDARGKQLTKYKEEEQYDNPKCNMRIEELAKPNRMHVKLIFKDYKKRLPERNVKAVLLYLREEFAKSPEETEEDFNELLHKEKVKYCRKVCVQEARKKHFQKIAGNRRKHMLNILRDILRKYISRAYFNPKQIIMTTRLRRVSNIILKELCKIRGVPVPKRDSTKIRAQLMCATADFFAYCIDTIYYEVQVQKVVDYDLLKEQRQPLHSYTVPD